MKLKCTLCRRIIDCGKDADDKFIEHLVDYHAVELVDEYADAA